MFSTLFRTKHQYDLSVVAIFKNESHALIEWLEHYIQQGVDHFYLIDNGSTDDSVAKMQPYLHKGLITLHQDDEKWAQTKLYNKYFLKATRKESEWVIVCDLDEFIYARNGHETIKAYLNSRPKNTGLIRIPWKMFGSCGLIEQPETITPSFTKRCLNDGGEKPWTDLKGFSTSKVIVRSRYLKKIGIHHSKIKKNCQIENANAESIDLTTPNHQPISEQILESAFLHLNHYPLQSQRWFLNTKAKRGAADNQNHENVRGMRYFTQYDAACNDIEDQELALKHQLRFKNIARK